jgi:hypothetical protein
MTLTWQDIAALLVVLAAIGYVMVRLRRFSRRKDVAACGGCLGCAGGKSGASCDPGVPPVVLHQITPDTDSSPPRTRKT